MEYCVRIWSHLLKISVIVNFIFVHRLICYINPFVIRLLNIYRLLRNLGGVFKDNKFLIFLFLFSTDFLFVYETIGSQFHDAKFCNNSLKSLHTSQIIILFDCLR